MVTIFFQFWRSLGGNSTIGDFQFLREALTWIAKGKGLLIVYSQQTIGGNLILQILIPGRGCALVEKSIRGPRVLSKSSPR